MVKSDGTEVGVFNPVIEKLMGDDVKSPFIRIVWDDTLTQFPLVISTLQVRDVGTINEFGRVTRRYSGKIVDPDGWKSIFKEVSVSKVRSANVPVTEEKDDPTVFVNVFVLDPVAYEEILFEVFVSSKKVPAD